jgi:hypothetical protein
VNEAVLTLDIDWAPDCAIDWVASQLVSHQVRATWFVTHSSPAVQRLRDHPELFELGIHPNFLPGSSHGSTPGAVLDHCMELLPDASSLRSHALVQSTPLLALIASDTPITADVSLFLPYAPDLRPHEFRVGGRTLLRLPYFWEDDDEMVQPSPCWQLAPMLGIGAGLKVFDFHPIHVYMNAVGMVPYRSLLRRVPQLQNAEEGDFCWPVRNAEGTQSLFMQLVEHLAGSAGSLRVHDVELRCRAAVKGAGD